MSKYYTLELVIVAKFFQGIVCFCTNEHFCSVVIQVSFSIACLLQMQYNMSKHKYTRIPAIDEKKDEFTFTKMSSLVWIENISNERFKFLKDKRISNPFGNVYHKKRMSISCPSTPIRGKFKPVAQLLAEVSEKLLEESESSENKKKSQSPGNISQYISPNSFMF